MKKICLTLTGVLVLSAGLFWLINKMTVRPGSISGNGNVAILFMMPLPLLFIVSLILWYFIFKKQQPRFSIVASVLSLLAVGIGVGIYYQQRYRIYLFQVNKELHGWVDWDYIQSITDSLASPHVNSQYFNGFTYLLFNGATIFAGLLTYAVWGRQRQNMRVR
ncbi:ABC-type sugar transport system permease subunit [Sporosarcina luteola]|nr:ABC-type sugar transport system permease subunit [Sporosarcina luteola]